MTKPAEIIATLDASLAEHGETLTLRRRIGSGNTFIEVTVRGRVVGYRSEPLSGAVKQTESEFLISPTEILAASATWPGAAGGGIHPKIGDILVSDGEAGRRIEAVRPVRIGGVVVRYEGRVLG